MFILGHLFDSLALLFSLLFKMLYFLIAIRVLLSWFPVDPFNEVVRAVYALTDPVLSLFRRLPLQIGVIDISPILAFLAISFLDNFVVGLLHKIALQLAG